MLAILQVLPSLLLVPANLVRIQAPTVTIPIQNLVSMTAFGVSGALVVPYLSGDPSSSYGAENACGGDGSADDFYWGSRTATTDYALYFAVKRVGAQCIV